MTDVYTVRQGSLFIQSGPSADPEYLPCQDLADMPSPRGDIALIQAFDVAGDYESLGFTQAAPAPITTTLTTYIQKLAQYLERTKCPFYLHVNLRCDGLANIINNYERGVVLKVVAVTNRTLKALVMREGEGKAEQDFDIAALPPFFDIYRLVPDRQTLTEVLALNDVHFLNPELCGPCTPRYDLGSIGVATADAVGAGTANVRYTLTGGADWLTAAADPFAADEHIMPVTGFWISGKVYRFLVGRGVTDAGAPAEVAYTDFNVETGTAIGAAWTLANVGATNAQFFFGPKSLFAYDQFNIWGVAGAGFIYKSENGGLTWTAQESGVLTIEDYYVIDAAPRSKLHLWAAGENNAIARTRDGGRTWSAVTGPAAQATDEILTLDVINEQTVIIGYNDGLVYITYNAGVTWSQITNFSSTGVAQVRAIQFLNEVQGFMLTNTSVPVGVMHVTRDCGRSWEALTTPTNAGLNALAVLSNTTAFAVGEAVSALAVILRTASG